MIVDIKLQATRLLQRRQYDHITDDGSGVVSRMNVADETSEELEEIVRISDSIDAKVTEALSLNLEQRPRISRTNRCKLYSYLVCC